MVCTNYISLIALSYIKSPTTTMTAFNVESILRDQLSGFDDDLLNYVVSMVEEMSLEEKVISITVSCISY